MIICLVIIFHVDTMEAAENTTDINYPTNNKVTKKYQITTKTTKNTNKVKNNKIDSNSNLKSKQNRVQYPKQNTKLKYNNKDIEFKNPVKKGDPKDTPKVILGKNVQPPSKTIKVKSHSPITPKKKLSKQPIIQNKNKAIIPTNKNQKTNASIKQK